MSHVGCRHDNDMPLAERSERRDIKARSSRSEPCREIHSATLARVVRRRNGDGGTRGSPVRCGESVYRFIGL